MLFLLYSHIGLITAWATAVPVSAIRVLLEEKEGRRRAKRQKVHGLPEKVRASRLLETNGLGISKGSLLCVSRLRETIEKGISKFPLWV